eukprot:scaffold11341_cov28-Tisochrysis_lutea.AAC.7
MSSTFGSSTRCRARGRSCVLSCSARVVSQAEGRVPKSEPLGSGGRRELKTASSNSRCAAAPRPIGAGGRKREGERERGRARERGRGRREGGEREGAARKAAPRPAAQTERFFLSFFVPPLASATARA